MGALQYGLTILVASIAFGAVPDKDVRNTYTPNTDTHFAMPAYRTLAEWEARRLELRKQILSAAGLLPMPEKTPLHPTVFGRIERDGYTIEKVQLETIPGYYLGGNLYRPRTAGRHPAVLIPHGHWDYGRLENQPLNSTPVQGVNMARQGYVVFAYDMVGYNDTAQTPHDFGGLREYLWAFGPLQLQLWNSIRALDFVSALEDVDSARLGITGASGGGTQTFLLTAVDDRIAFTAPVNMVSGIMQGGSPCENAASLRVGTSNVEIAAMAAPRPMMIVSGTQDWTKNVPREEFPAIRAIYELYGKPGNVANVQVDAPHNYNRESREAVYRFFGKHVLGIEDPERLRERGARVEKLQDMLVFAGRPLPEGALDFKGVFSSWRARESARLNHEDSVEAARTRMAVALGAVWPEDVESQADGTAITLTRAGKGDRVAGLWFPGRGVPALVVGAAGARAAVETGTAKELRNAGRPVLLIDAFQTGTSVAPRDRSHPFFLTFNRSDDANRVQDILTALRFLSGPNRSRVELVGMDNARLWCVFAAAVVPIQMTFKPDVAWFGGQDQDYLDRFFVPGIQAAGGIGTAKRLAGVQ